MIVKKEVEFVKQTDDVMVLINELVKDIKAGKPMAEVGAENLPLLMEAISGVGEVPAEISAGVIAYQTIGFRVGELMGILTGKV